MLSPAHVVDHVYIFSHCLVVDVVVLGAAA